MKEPYYFRQTKYESGMTSGETKEARMHTYYIST